MYYSLDNGTTNLKGFNSNPSGDLQDWASGSNDSFNAFSSSGVQNDMTPLDLQVMDILGFELVPEPGRALLAVLGLTAVLMRRHRTKGNDQQ